MKRNILTFLSHFFSGVITTLAIFVNPVLAIILFLTFIIYELNEDWRLSDKAFIDIRQFGYGAFLTSVILIVLHLL